MLNELEDYLKEKVNIVLVWNKCDSLDRVITEEEGINLVKEYKIDFFETPAKNNKNIFELLYLWINKLLRTVQN